MAKRLDEISANTAQTRDSLVSWAKTYGKRSAAAREAAGARQKTRQSERILRINAKSAEGVSPSKTAADDSGFDIAGVIPSTPSLGQKDRAGKDAAIQSPPSQKTSFPSTHDKDQATKSEKPIREQESKSAIASERTRQARRDKATGRFIADALGEELGKKRGILERGKEILSQQTDAKDALGYAAGGPLYGVFKELKQALPRITRDKKDKAQVEPDIQNEARRDVAQLEMLEDQFEQDAGENRKQDKRHKEMVRAVKANHRGMLERFLDRRASRGGRGIFGNTKTREIIRERDIAPDTRQGKSKKSQDTDSKKRSRGRVSSRREMLGRLGRAASKTGGIVAEGTLKSIGALGGMITKAAPMLAGAMAIYDGFKGWNDTGLHKQAFGLKDGQEATTGQKASAAAASILDMGGLTSSMLEMLGIEFDKAGVAKSIYEFGSNIATVAQGFLVQAGPMLQKVWNGVECLAGKFWSGAKDIGGEITNVAIGIWDKGAGLIARVGSGIVEIGGAISGFASSILNKGGELASTISNWAKSAIAEGAGLLTSLWKEAQKLPGAIVEGAKDLATSAVETGGKLFSKGWDVLTGFFKGKKTENATYSNQISKSAPDANLSKNQSLKLVDNQTETVLQTAPAPDVKILQAKFSDPARHVPTSSEIANRTTTLEQTNLKLREDRNQSEITDGLEDIGGAVIRQTKLFEDRWRQEDAEKDPFGIKKAMDATTQQLSAMRNGGSYYVNETSAGFGAAATAFAYNPDSKIGDTIARYESGNAGVNKIGYDSTGGTSYGKWQLASKTGSYEDWLKHLESKGEKGAAIAAQLRAAGPANTGGKSGQHVEVYLKLAAENAEFFEETQRESLLKNNYNVSMAKIKSDSLRKMIENDKSIQEMLFSTSVQHGGAGGAKVLNNAWKEDIGRDDFIKAVYDYRGTQFGSSTGQVQAGVRKRFAEERNMIIGMNAGEERATQARDATEAAMAEGGNAAINAGASALYASAANTYTGKTGYFMRKSDYKGPLTGKDLEQGVIDCSGWVAEINRRMMSGMNQVMGGEVFNKNARNILEKGANGGAAGLIKTIGDATGTIYSTEDLANAKEGMMIGLGVGKHARDRFKGIGHIVQTYRDPETGELMVSESRGGKGVMKTRYADWYQEQKRKGVALHGVDAMALADPSRIAPAKQAVSQDVVSVAQQRTQASIDAQSAQLRAPHISLAQNLDPQAPQSLSQMQAGPTPAVNMRERPEPESIRKIDPGREASSGKQDMAPVLQLLAQMLQAIQSGNEKVARAVASLKLDNGQGGIGMDYSPENQALAKS